MDRDSQVRFRSFKRSKILAAVVSIVLGATLFLWPKASLDLVCRIIAIALLVDGIVLLISGFVRKDAGKAVPLISGVVALVLGLWILISPDAFIAFIPTLMGIIVTADGVLNLMETATLGRQKYGRWPLSLGLSVLTILLGLMLIFKPLGIANFIVRILGAVILYNGISDLWIASRIRTAIDPSKVVEDVDVEVHEED